MSIVVKPKHSETAGRVPTATDLVDGEFAINTADRKVYQRVGAAIVLVADAADYTDTITKAGNLAIAMGYAFR